MVFSARKGDKWPPKNQHLGSNFCLLRGPFWQFSRSKKSIFWLFESCFGVIQKLFGYCFRPQKAIFCEYFRLERLVYDPQNQTLDSNFCLLMRVNFDNFQDQKSFFWLFDNYFQDFQKLFGHVFGLKRSSFIALSAQKVYIFRKTML